MRVAMIGTGYVGLTTGACFASLGNNVICLDIDGKRISELKEGKLPFYEPELKEMVQMNSKEGRLHFTIDSKEAIQNSDIIFITVGTPSGDDGEADLKYVFAVAETIGKNMDSYKVVVDKSTVPVGTADEVRKRIIAAQTQAVEFDVVSNPEFLREGKAIDDFMNPDRIVVGAESEKAKEIMIRLYKSLERANRPIIVCDVKSAEIIKYASNAMLATRISFMNEVSHLCERVGADIKMVARGMGYDNRIGPRFLQAGIGYGGSCFPKDVKALAHTLKKHSCDSKIMDAVNSVNENQKKSLIPKINAAIPDLNGKTIAVWGLAFKPKTDDMREAPSIEIIKALLERGAKVKAFDPVAKEVAAKLFPEIEYSNNPYDALEGSHGVVICTEWDEFRNLDRKKWKNLMVDHHVFDGRNIYDSKEIRSHGFKYYSVGRK